jgi:hypothetical protein
MSRMNLEQVVKDTNRRLDRIEQILPTLPTREESDKKIAKLATKKELQAAVAKLATKKELQAAIAKLATKEELRAEVATLAPRAAVEELRAEIATLATKEEMRAVRKDLDAFGERLDTRITEESERSRRETRVLFESLKDDIRIVAEGVVSVQTTIDQAIRPVLLNHERRITTLEDRHAPL